MADSSQPDLCAFRAISAALENVIGASLRDGRTVPELPNVMRDYIEMRRQLGLSTSRTRVLTLVTEMIIEQEQSERSFRDPFGRASGDEDPVQKISELAQFEASRAQSA